MGRRTEGHVWAPGAGKMNWEGPAVGISSAISSVLFRSKCFAPMSSHQVRSASICAGPISSAHVHAVQFVRSGLAQSPGGFKLGHHMSASTDNVDEVSCAWGQVC